MGDIVTTGDVSDLVLAVQRRCGVQPVSSLPCTAPHPGYVESGPDRCSELTGLPPSPRPASPQPWSVGRWRGLLQPLVCRTAGCWCGWWRPWGRWRGRSPPCGAVTAAAAAGSGATAATPSSGRERGRPGRGSGPWWRSPAAPAGAGTDTDSVFSTLKS